MPPSTGGAPARPPGAGGPSMLPSSPCPPFDVTSPPMPVLRSHYKQAHSAQCGFRPSLRPATTAVPFLEYALPGQWFLCELTASPIPFPRLSLHGLHACPPPLARDQACRCPSSSASSATRAKRTRGGMVWQSCWHLQSGRPRCTAMAEMAEMADAATKPG